MKALIIEDEISASKRLTKLINEIDPSIEILKTLESIEDSVEWFQNNEEPDLILSDIQLSDGLSFEIYNQVNISCPIIFVTAYEEYAVKAFKLNSIDYLLKPVNINDLRTSIEKYKKMKDTLSDTQNNIQTLLEHLNIKKPEYKTRFLVKMGETFKTISVEEIAYFYVDNELVFILTKDKKRHIVDNTLEDLEKMLDPDLFFRANRQFIVKLDSIDTIHTYFNGKLKVNIIPEIDKELIISREKAGDFKKWLDK